MNDDLSVLLLGFSVVSFGFADRLPRKNRPRRKGPPLEPPPRFGQRAKPRWVAEEVLRLKALMPENGCRKIAATFNSLYGGTRGQTVGKSFVAKVLKIRGHEIAGIRRKIKNRRPKPFPRNRIWAIDLTYVNGLPPILGILDHGTRACLTLESLRSKASLEILKALVRAVESFGRPARLRTDNEPLFTSKLFRFGLWILGIRHQRIAPFAPWQNGRIERFFGTFKERIQRWPTALDRLSQDLTVFRFWYNHVRPHQHLDGFTPAQVWAGVHVDGRRWKARFFSKWDGLLTGFWLEDT